MIKAKETIEDDLNLALQTMEAASNKILKIAARNPEASSDESLRQVAENYRKWQSN